MVDLNDLVEPGSGVVVSDVRGINDHGQIVGIGTKDGNIFTAFLLSPVPETQTTLMFLAGLGVLLITRRRLSS
ncbi:hypothetical protein [Roseateles sp. P5_E1]